MGYENLQDAIADAEEGDSIFVSSSLPELDIQGPGVRGFDWRFDGQW
jgi:hypothetical protein